MRILVVGDIHGNIAAVELAYDMAALMHVDAILQVGDFGCFPQIPSFRRFLRVASRLASEKSLPLFFVDGNHEDHFYLPHQGTCAALHTVLPGIFWLPRGFHWEWSGVSFASLGGAHSIDRITRVIGATVFPNIECIQPSDVFSCVASSADVLVCHDAPTEIDFALKYEYPDGIRNREAISQVIDTIHPRIVLHGHYHRYHDTVYAESRVIGLACEKSIVDLFGLLTCADSTVTFEKVDITDNAGVITKFLDRNFAIAYTIPEDIKGLDAPW